MSPIPGWEPGGIQEVMGVLGREIGGPLTAIEVAVDRLRRRCGAGAAGPRPPDIEETESELRVILEQSHRLAGLARTLLAVARPVQPRPRPVFLDQVVAEVTNLIRVQAEASGIELVTTLEGGGRTVWGDPHQLRETLLALLSNALLALEGWPGERRLEVTTGRWRDEMGFVRVRDSGPGVPRGREDRIFLPFISNWGRQGVGLALSRLSLLRQGGDLLLQEQEEPVGATFLLVLPNDSRIGDHDEEPGS